MHQLLLPLSMIQHAKGPTYNTEAELDNIKVKQQESTKQQATEQKTTPNS